jgi:putative lipoprotein (rSAM/lipoprotein system)
MKIIKVKFLTGYNIVITALLAVLGFSTSCGPFGGTEYGVPHARFIIKGKVTSSANNKPVPNIKVRMDGDTASRSFMEADSAYTDSNGYYQVSDEYGFPDSHSYTIQFSDIDGSVNGDFQTIDSVIEFKDPVFTGGGRNWDSGETQKELNIILKPKK